MTQPTPYRRGYDFSDAGGAQPPGGPLDGELDALARTTREILRNLALLQRDDTGLRNGIVGIDALDNRVLGLLSGGTFSIAGTWTTATAYVAGAFFSDDEAIYLTMEAHTSTSIVSDLAAGLIVKVLQNEQGERLRDDFTGDGVQTAFTLSQSPARPSDVEVYVEGLLVSADDYAQTGTTVTFDVAPGNGDAISIFSITWATTPPIQTLVDAVGDRNAEITASTQFLEDVDGAGGAELIGLGNTNVSVVVPYTPQQENATVNGIANDYTAIHAAKVSAWAAGLRTLNFPDGVYAYGTKLELAKDHWGAQPLGENARLKFTGAGVAASLLGPTVDATYGCYKGKLGGENAFIIEGNAACTRLLEIDNYHHGFVNVDLKEGQLGVYIFDSINNASSAGAVLTHFKVRISQGNDGTFTTKPATGFYASEMYACKCELIIEHCGGGGNFGIYITNSAANRFYGTSEANATGGVLIASDSYRNTFDNFFCEENGTGFDFDVRGTYNRFLLCSAVSNSGSEISGDYNQVIGGEWKNLTITSAAAYTVLDGVNLLGTFTDNSTTTTIRNCRLEGVPIPDYAPVTGGALSLGTNISNYALTDSTYQAPAYFRLPNGLGEVLGTFAATGAISIGDTIATIPSGYRPAKRITFTGYNISTNAVMGITIDSSGNVVTRTAIANGNVFGFGSPQFPRA